MLGDTPMMIQYQNIKDQYQDCILFYRLGDFYEMFGADAEKAAKLLEIALTSREAGKGKRIPMCGVPFHSADNYIAKLINKGYKVAICEQVENPKEAKGIVKRDVIRIVTPGTVLENTILRDATNNFLIALTHSDETFGLAAVDASTGDFYATEVKEVQTLLNEILRYNPVECIIPQDDQEIQAILSGIEGLVIFPYLDYAFKKEYCEKLLLDHFQINSLKSFGCDEFPTALRAAGAVIDYIVTNQKTKPINITNLNIYHLTDKMFLDFATKRNLELIQSIQAAERKDSLLGVIDHTVTAFGGRMLKNWIEQPLVDKNKIQKRLDGTGELVNDHTQRKKLRKLLNPMYDLERITARVSFGSANPRDLLSLKSSIGLLPEIIGVLAKAECASLAQINRELDNLEDIYLLTNESIMEEPATSLREGNIIRDGFNSEVDRLRMITQNAKQWIVNLEQEEKDKTGIRSLKIGFNKVFGYFIEITKSNLHLVPESYTRKQTLANAERYITPELKELEAQVLGADERLKELEYQIFCETRENIKKHIPRILKTSKLLAELDCLCSLAEIAVLANFVKPEIDDSGIFSIRKCRHPVVEKKLAGNWFIPNDLYLDNDQQRFLIITGPNMAGKSTYCRSIALISILMQIGSFVPAEKAVLPIVDRVFARIGASDDLSTGQSTFMVEMNEVANIVNNASERSLIILDEVGRGTSTYDGLSIAWSLTEFINSKLKAKTLFATHYHELTELEKQESGIKNFSIAVKEDNDHIVFLHKIIPGGADRSYGIQVAKLAGLPEEIIIRAKNILHDLENNNSGNHNPEVSNDQNNIENTKKSCSPEIIKRLTGLDLLNITPLQAINLIYELQSLAKKEV
ncbi:MAG: DNA mismatch repair protein MutS [Peptococcaceae bacterium]